MSTLDYALKEIEARAVHAGFVGWYGSGDAVILLAMLRKCREQRDAYISCFDTETSAQETREKSKCDAELLKLAGEGEK